jgi:hypothetical protein
MFISVKLLSFKWEWEFKPFLPVAVSILIIKSKIADVSPTTPLTKKKKKCEWAKHTNSI